MSEIRKIGSGCGGYCARCGREHFLDSASARPAAQELMRFFDKHAHINLRRPEYPPEAHTAIEPLFGPDRGKMFGVLICRNVHGQEVVLYGFSGRLNGRWQASGWVGPLFSEQAFHQCADRGEQKIKELGRRMDQEIRGGAAWHRLRQERRLLSRQLTQRIFALYRIPDFRGHSHSLARIFIGKNGIPTGTGDCCAPKLLAHAAKARLYPVSLAEFYYGRENLSATKRHKQFYPSCAEKCRPILGAMLCGLRQPD